MYVALPRNGEDNNKAVKPDLNLFIQIYGKVILGCEATALAPALEEENKNVQPLRANQAILGHHATLSPLITG